MNNIIIKNINIDNKNILDLKLWLSYYDSINYYYHCCDNILLKSTIFNIFLLLLIFIPYYIFLIYKNNLNIEFYTDIFIILIFIEFYRFFVNTYKSCYKIYEECLDNIFFKYNFCIESILILSSLIFLICKYYKYNFVYFNIKIIILIFPVIKIFLRFLVYIFVIISYDSNISGIIYHDELLVFNRLCKNDKLFTDKKYKINKNMFLVKYNNNLHEENCCICLDNYLKNEKIIRLSCNHHFHKECLLNWILINSSCPICRKLII